MKQLMAFLFFLSGLITFQSYADTCCRDRQHFYAGLSGGASFLNSSLSGAKFKPGYYAGGALGYTCTNPFRIEAEMAFQKEALDSAKGSHQAKGHLSTWLGMGNILFDYEIGCDWGLYIGGGAGYAYTAGKWSVPFENDSWGSNHAHFTFTKHGFAWQAMGGLSYPICQQTELALEYRYFDAANRVTNHKFGLAIRQYF